MSISIASYQAGGYQVATPIYEGPLDLLLQLIERAELDITKLSLAQVTDQYLVHLRAITDLSTSEVSAFLVIAARLLQIKSEALLPRPPIRTPGEEDPGEALARQLQAYKRFKEIAAFLENRQQTGLHTYLRLAAPPKIEQRADLGKIGLPEFLAAARSAFSLAAHADLPVLSSVVAAPKVSIRQKISLIIRLLRKYGQITFRSILDNGDSNGAHSDGPPSRIDIMVTFLAMLELVKRRLVHVQQEQLFGEIVLDLGIDFKNNNGSEPSDLEFELEFDE